MKYRAYTHFSIHVVSHIEDWRIHCECLEITEESAGMHGSALECTGILWEFLLDFCTISPFVYAA